MKIDWSNVKQDVILVIALVFFVILVLITGEAVGVFDFLPWYMDVGIWVVFGIVAVDTLFDKYTVDE